MVVKQRYCKIKREVLPKYIYLCSDKGDLKGFQTNFETFSTSICHNLTPIKQRTSVRQAHIQFKKKTKNYTGLGDKLKFNDYPNNFSFKNIQ